MSARRIEISTVIWLEDGVDPDQFTKRVLTALELISGVDSVGGVDWEEEEE